MNLKYILASAQTLSYWKYALLSKGALSSIVTIAGGLYLFVEMLDTFGMYTKANYSSYVFFVIIAVSVVITVLNRRPVSQISYKIPKKDFVFEVLIGDIMDAVSPNVVISTNTTFDTDIATGLIAQDSLQGQMALKYFKGNTGDIDKQIKESLKGVTSVSYPEGKVNKKKYPIGTVATVSSHGKSFFMPAMAELNEHGTAHSNVHMVDTALESLWHYIAERGELGDIAIPAMGTGRGRIQLSRKKVIEKIAQSFADASSEKVFCGKLVIYIHHQDAVKYNVNLFEIKDYLVQSLHV